LVAAAQRKDVTDVLLANHNSVGISVQIIPASFEETTTFRQISFLAWLGKELRKLLTVKNNTRSVSAFT
jgi:hypothetical protein